MLSEVHGPTREFHPATEGPRGDFPLQYPAAEVERRRCSADGLSYLSCLSLIGHQAQGVRVTEQLIFFPSSLFSLIHLVGIY